MSALARAASARRIYDDSNNRRGRRDYNRTRPADDYGAFLRASDQVALSAGDKLKVPPRKPFARASSGRGRMTFAPFAKLQPKQVKDLRHSGNFLYLLRNARQEQPLAAAALRRRDYGVYYQLTHPGKKLLPAGAAPRTHRRVG